MELDEKRLYEILRELGLSKREADIYLTLSRKGPRKAHAVAETLDIDRAQTYRSLTNLQEKGMVQLTLEAPTRYMAVPMETLVESLISAKKSEVERLTVDKAELISYLASISRREPETATAKFQIIAGRKAIYAKISQMMKQSTEEMLGLTTSIGLVQADTMGFLDEMLQSANEKRNVQFKLLADISKENLNVIKSIAKRIPHRRSNIEWRHAEIASKLYPRFIIRDEEEALLYVISREEPTSATREDSGLWINSKMFVSTLKASFMEIWRSAVDLNERINELETGVPIQKTIVIKEAEDAQAKIKEALETAENEALVISSSTGINKISENDPFRKYSRKGVKLRIMAPIDLDNYAAALDLCKVYEVKHVLISYLTMMIVDKKHLFMFKSPPPEEEASKSLFYLPNMFYTNDQNYVERASELLTDIWKRGTSVSVMESGGSMGPPIVEVASSCAVSDVVNIMLKTNANPVLVKEGSNAIGIIDCRDILEKAVKAQKDLKRIPASEIASTPVLTVDSDQPLIDALKTMKQKHIPRLAVMKNGKLIAMLT